MERKLGYDRRRIRRLLEQHDVLIQEWDRVQTDWLTLRGEVLVAPEMAV